MSKKQAVLAFVGVLLAFGLSIFLGFFFKPGGEHFVYSTEFAALAGVLFVVALGLRRKALARD